MKGTSSLPNILDLPIVRLLPLMWLLVTLPYWATYEYVQWRLGDQSQYRKFGPPKLTAALCGMCGVLCDLGLVLSFVCGGTFTLIALLVGVRVVANIAAIWKSFGG